MSEDFLGYARGIENGRYLGLLFGSPGSVTIDESSVLIEKDIALEQKKKDIQARGEAAATGGTTGPSTGFPTGSGSAPMGGGTSAGPTGVGGARKRFFATKELNPQRARLDFNEIIDSVLIKLTARHSTSVSISVEIVAEDSPGFDQGVQADIKSACSKLNFKQSDFADD